MSVSATCMWLFLTVACVGLPCVIVLHVYLIILTFSQSYPSCLFCLNVSVHGIANEIINFAPGEGPEKMLCHDKDFDMQSLYIYSKMFYASSFEDQRLIILSRCPI